MKILRRNDDFKKMPETCVEEVLIIKNLINQGWNYCSKEVYKEHVGKKETKAEKVEKVVREKAIKEKIREKTPEKKSDNKKSDKKSDKKKGRK